MAQDLLTETVYKNKNSDKWILDTTKKVAIWACGDELFQDKPSVDKVYYTRGKICGTYFYSCYVPPSLPQSEYEKILDELVKEAMATTPNIIAGVFNACALELGSKTTTPRGLKIFALLDAVLLITEKF